MSDDDRNALPRGFELDGYRIESVLGVGGFGITYRAVDPIGRQVAIKEFLPKGCARREAGDATVRPNSAADRAEFEWGLARFRDEAKVLLSVKHPNVVHTLRYTEAHGTAYIVMDFVEGGSLDAVLKKAGTLEQADIERFLFPLLEGLAAVHAKGYLHRDIKPDNIYVRAEDSQPVLLDFGAAREMARHTHTVVLSHGYAPFEQYQSQSTRAPSADIYALGATLYVCMTGARPPRATDRVGGRDPLVPLASAAKRRYSPALIGAVERALRVAAEERPQSVAELRDILGIGRESRSDSRDEAKTLFAAVSPPTPEPVNADHTPPPPAPAPPAPKRSRAGSLFVALILIGAAIAGAYHFTRPSSDAPPSTSSAQPEGAAPPPAGRTFRDCPECPEMVVIPGGTFTMGSPDGEKEGESNERPQRNVRVAPFLLGKYEVTRGEYGAFVRESGHRMTGGCDTYNAATKLWAENPNADWLRPGFAQTDNHPVVCVSWDDAKAYAGWLSRKTGKTYRLPSEAEWEYAARAGTVTRMYWGDDPDMREACRYANVHDERAKWMSTLRAAPCDDGHAFTAPVGSYVPNRFGLHDMSGNVYEWVEDCLFSYVGAPTDGRASVTGGKCEFRVRRGGSWSDYAAGFHRSARREYDAPAARGDTYGFRLARTH